MTRFASTEDFEYCRDLHRKFGTTYFLASRAFPAELQRRTDAVYGFVRVPDEWVDNPGSMSLQERREKLLDFRDQLKRGMDGHRPENPALRAFCDVARETGIPLEEAELFLDAMEMDLDVVQYPTYRDLERYMRGSAAAVGVMMCYALGVPMHSERNQAACNLGYGMQMTNFLRDVAEDAVRGRVYIPVEDLERFGLSVNDVYAGEFDERWHDLISFEIDRTRALYAAADPEIDRLPSQVRKAVKLARILYSRILNRIEDQQGNVFLGRVRTSKFEKMAVAARVVLLG